MKPLRRLLVRKRHEILRSIIDLCTGSDSFDALLEEERTTLPPPRGDEGKTT